MIRKYVWMILDKEYFWNVMQGCKFMDLQLVLNREEVDPFSHLQDMWGMEE